MTNWNKLVAIGTIAMAVATFVSLLVTGTLSYFQWQELAKANRSEIFFHQQDCPTQIIIDKVDNTSHSPIELTGSNGGKARGVFAVLVSVEGGKCNFPMITLAEKRMFREDCNTVQAWAPSEGRITESVKFSLQIPENVKTFSFRASYIPFEHEDTKLNIENPIYRCRYDYAVDYGSQIAFNLAK